MDHDDTAMDSTATIHRLPEIRAYMQENTLGILESVEAFEAFILQ